MSASHLGGSSLLCNRGSDRFPVNRDSFEVVAEVLIDDVLASLLPVTRQRITERLVLITLFDTKCLTGELGLFLESLFAAP